MKVLYIVPFLFILIFFSCSGQKKITVTTTKQDILTEEQKFDFTYNLFEADKYYLDEQYDLAEGYYQRCIKIYPGSALVNYKLASIYLYKKEQNTAKFYIEKCLAINDTNIWYLYFAGNIYKSNKEYDKAIVIFKKLISLNASELDFYMNLAEIYLLKGDTKLALKVYDEVETKFGILESISLEKNKIYISLNKVDKAAEELVKLAGFYNNDKYYLRLLGNFYIQVGQVNKALDVYNNMLKDNTNDGYAHLGLAECYRILQNFDQAFKELKLAFRSNDVESDLKVSITINLLQSIQNSKDLFNQVLELTEVLVQLYPDNPDVNTIYADFQLKLGNVDIARSALIKVIEVRKDRYHVWEQLLAIDNEFKDWISLYKHSKETLEYFPNQPIVYFFNGFSAFQLEYFDESKKSLELGLQILPKDNVLRNDFLTFLGEVNYKLGYKKEAYSYFDKLLNVDPDNISILNNYSYYLSLDKTDLQKAENMSYKTIEKEPENATYLDTYAWIQFIKGDYVKALEYIKKAVKFNNNASDVILEHYGDILYYNNMIDEAVVQWKSASKIGNGSGKLEEKIEKRKYVE